MHAGGQEFESPSLHQFFVAERGRTKKFFRVFACLSLFCTAINAQNNSHGSSYRRFGCMTTPTCSRVLLCCRPIDRGSFAGCTPANCPVALPAAACWYRRRTCAMMRAAERNMGKRLRSGSPGFSRFRPPAEAGTPGTLSGISGQPSCRVSDANHTFQTISNVLMKPTHTGMFRPQPRIVTSLHFLGQMLGCAMSFCQKFLSRVY